MSFRSLSQQPAGFQVKITRPSRKLNPPRRMCSFSSVARGQVADKCFHFAGGWDTHGKVLSTVEKYDVTTGTSGTWTEEASLNVARGRHSACVIRNKIYVAGG